MSLRQTLIALRARRSSYRIAIDILLPKLRPPEGLENIHAPTMEHLDRARQRRCVERAEIEEARFILHLCIGIAVLTLMLTGLFIAIG